ncbi:MAG TPA: hypothetical protein VKG23_04050 [Thermoanaerobaculia bacterium]|nr:hypothetical protein [Thermoanaerobaculia bacterium]
MTAALAALLVMAAGLTGHAAASSEPKGAEFAVRWDPARGGPTNAAETLTFLGAADVPSERYEVQFYDLPAPHGAPPGATVILRRRTAADGSAEIRLKYRSASPIASWACPDPSFHAKAQVDVGFGADAPSRVDSYSCVLSAAQPPADLHAVPKRCVSQMVRYDAERSVGYKVEAWTLPDGSTRLEVSRSAKNSVDELARFTHLVERLAARGVRPLEESKTELGSHCP